MLAQTIPVLDLHHFTQGSSTNRFSFVQNLGQALAQVGFFALENHGIEAGLLQSAYGASEAFFALPEATKYRYEAPTLKGQRGFTRFGKEHAKDHPMPDLKEFWHVGREISDLPNLWPREVPQFQPVMLELYQRLETCATHLLSACALYLGQSEDFFADEVTQGDTILRIIHYPPVPEDATPESLRAAPHEDINLITLLCEATSAGLELLQPDGSWLPVAAISGQIIVDTGDMLQSLSNGLFKSTTHQVINPDNHRERRFSMPFFVHPRPQFDLTPLTACVKKTGGHRRFPSQTAKAYLEQRLCEIGLA
jgi:isopenicillin N synthase-like dioxygenase